MGDHIRARRLERGMLQYDIAADLKITVGTLISREKNRRMPQISAYQDFFIFLGYNPVESPNSQRTFGDRLVLIRHSLEITQRDAAKRIGIDPGTLSNNM